MKYTFKLKINIVVPATVSISIDAENEEQAEALAIDKVKTDIRMFDINALDKWSIDYGNIIITNLEEYSIPNDPKIKVVEMLRIDAE